MFVDTPYYTSFNETNPLFGVSLSTHWSSRTHTHTHARSRYTDIEGRSSRAIRVEERHKRKKRKRIKWRRRGVEVILTRFPTFGVGGFAEHAVEGVGRA